MRKHVYGNVENEKNRQLKNEYCQSGKLHTFIHSDSHT
jgi:hypothetical protein